MLDLVISCYGITPDLTADLGQTCVTAPPSV